MEEALCRQNTVTPFGSCVSKDFEGTTPNY